MVISLLLDAALVLIGAISDQDLIGRVGLVGRAIVLVGVIARMLGAFIALNLTRSGLNDREKLARFMPGVLSGETILSIAVMSILLMAPLASVAIELTYRKLLVRAPQHASRSSRPMAPRMG